MQTDDTPPPNEKPSRPAGMSIKLTILAVVIAVCLGIGFFVVEHRRNAENDELNNQTAANIGTAPLVDVVGVKYAAPTQSMTLPGETRGWYQSTIYARVSGYVGQWFSDIGDRVHKGQVLATIETPDLDQQLVAAQQKLAVSQAEVKVMEANAEFAKKTNQRWKDSPKGVVSDQEREEKEAEFSSSVARVNAAEAQVNADKADVDRLNDLEEFKKVSAPYDGVITERRIDIGDLVTAGSTSTTTLLYSIAQINEIRVFVDVPQRIAGSLDMDAEAVATTDEFPGKKFQGKIARTSRAIDPSSRTLRVEVDIQNPDLLLMPGMYVQVMLQLTHKRFVEVPASALMFRSAGPQVAVVGDDGKISFRNIEIGVDQGDVVEIASGLSIGERVALNLSSQVADGDRVTANQTETADADSPPAEHPNGILTSAAQAQ